MSTVKVLTEVQTLSPIGLHVQSHSHIQEICQYKLLVLFFLNRKYKMNCHNDLWYFSFAIN